MGQDGAGRRRRAGLGGGSRRDGQVLPAGWHEPVALRATGVRPSLLDRLGRHTVADFRDKLAGVATVLTWWGGLAGAERGSCVSVGSVPRGSAPGAAPSGRARPGAPMADGASPSPVWAAGRHAAVVNGPIGGVQ